MRSSWIGYLLLDLSSFPRAARPSRRTAAHADVRATSLTNNHNLSNRNGNLRLQEGTRILAGSVNVEVTL